MLFSLINLVWHWFVNLFIIIYCVKFVLTGKENVTVKNLDEDEDSDFEANITVVTRKKRRHHTSFKDDDKENVKKFKRQRNKEGNVLKPRKLPKVVASGAEEAK